MNFLKCAFLLVIGIKFVLSDDINVTFEQMALNVLKNMHEEIDENKDGVIDSSEVELVLKDNAYESVSDLKNSFSRTYTKDSLWRMWKSSEAINWSKDIIILWLKYDVRLPQYSDIFNSLNINGSFLPRLAVSDCSYLRDILKINNALHCHKISLKAKSVILFGPSKEFLSKFPHKDILSYSIISNLHSQLDDDKDGGVDPDEADEFVRDELKYTSDFERAKKFNKDDNHISKEELWGNWKSSEVYNWTVNDVINWLCNHVELPEYEEQFRSLGVDGSLIPRLVQSDMTYLLKELKIRNPVHRKKIIIKATDLILFGPPKTPTSRAKDSILVSLLLITIAGCWMTYSKHKYSKQQLLTLQQQLKQLTVAETSLLNLQNKLEEAEKRTHKVTVERQEMEEKLRSELQKTKEELSRVDSYDDLKQCSDCSHLNFSDGSNGRHKLKLLLQITYETENSLFEVKRMSAMKQMEATKDMCEKIKKKRAAPMGSFRIAHSGCFDDMEKQLADSKLAIDQIKSYLEERTERWRKIEQITNMSLLPTPGLVKLRSELNMQFDSDGSTISGAVAPATAAAAATNSSTASGAMVAPAAATATANIYKRQKHITANIDNGHTNIYNNSTKRQCQVVALNERPKSLMLFQAGDSGLDVPLTTTTSTGTAMTTHHIHHPIYTVPVTSSHSDSVASNCCDAASSNSTAFSASQTPLPRVWSVSNNLAHLYTAASPCCAAMESHHQHFCGIPLTTTVNTNVGTDNENRLSSNTLNNKMSDKVRPFAFRWLKKSKK